MNSVHDRLLKRELGTTKVHSSFRGIYGARKWVKDLDIVNELSGHSGCVNALSWSRNGSLLASGSDDLRVNIYSYHPESSISQFSLSTSIYTGHTQNIFSVKFMPHSNDRTIVSAAGDAEVRIFDIEYAGQVSSTATSAGASWARRRTQNNVYRGVSYLSEGDTNAKVFRSHGDRVKRIVTESSPYHFLTCSEDGEVRQWDTRQPSSAYPPSREMSRLMDSSVPGSDNIPPPLISYKRYSLDLNTISCSPSQPHYIALGGAHLHCFLHDRRMLGRDKLAERGQNLPSPGTRSEKDEDTLSQATHCVRKFAPNGQQRMKRTDNGHITACKISDANPNEIVVSWSGEWIYSFDLVRTPDVRDLPQDRSSTLSKGKEKSKGKGPKVRKRKRPKASSVPSQDSAERTSSRPRTESTQSALGDERMTLKVNYGNGQSEAIPIEAPTAKNPVAEAHEATLPDSQRESFLIASTSLKMRMQIFTLGSGKKVSESDPTGHAASFTSALGFSASVIADMDEIMRSWRYPVNPLDVDVAFQNRLREMRASARRFVQASGVLARVLGGKLHTGSSNNSLQDYFVRITPAPNEPATLSRQEQFGYDFLKAILLWLDSGPGALLEGFGPFAGSRRTSTRFPVPRDARMDAIDEHLIPYLLRLAGPEPVFNVDSSRFEVDENRIVFTSEKAAVIAFAQAVKIPFADLSSAVVTTTSEGESTLTESHVSAQDRRTALRFWAFKIGRSMLMKVGRRVDFTFVDRAFGGAGRSNAKVKEEEATFRARYQEIDPNEPEDVIEDAVILRRPRDEEADDTRIDDQRNDNEDVEEVIPLSQVLASMAEDYDEEEEDDEDADVDMEGDDDSKFSSDDDSDGEGGRLIWRSAFERQRLREKVDESIPCVPHVRKYTGHCNVKTVKDVNFYGLEDEYVVSGSDSGHLFIWDRKTSQLLNILEGDDEVVNVVQGHPYEPMLAVSGIDHTIKIFSSDKLARHNARNGIGVAPADSSGFSSLSLGRSRNRRRDTSINPEAPTSEPSSKINSAELFVSDDEEADANVPPTGLSSRKRMQDEYKITSQNDTERRGGIRDTYITRQMLNQLAATLQERESNEDGDGTAAGGPIIINDDCTIM